MFGSKLWFLIIVLSVTALDSRSPSAIDNAIANIKRLGGTRAPLRSFWTKQTSMMKSLKYLPIYPT